MIPFFTLILFTFAADDEFQPRLPLRGALPIAEWEEDRDFMDLESFQENDIVLKWRANDHDRIMRLDSILGLLRAHGNNIAFPCPVTREPIPWNGVQKYILMRDPQQFVPSIEEQDDFALLGNIRQQWQEYQRQHRRYDPNDWRRDGRDLQREYVLLQPEFERQWQEWARFNEEILRRQAQGFYILYILEYYVIL